VLGWLFVDMWLCRGRLLMYELVPNPYRAAIRASKQSVVGDIDRLSRLLDDAVSALIGGAWTGGTAPDVLLHLDAIRADAKRTAIGAGDEFDWAIDTQPGEVEAGAWQTHWRNI
jgi:hypothetical protein